MSNRICVEPTEFVDVRSGEKTFGYRIYDSYNAEYDNNFASIPDDDLELLEQIIRSGVSDTIRDMLQWVVEMEQPIDIGGTIYEYEQIKNILEKL